MAYSHQGEVGPAVGIDLGTTYSVVAVHQNGRVQIIPNDQGNRITPSFVAFTRYERLIGDGAMNQAASNPCTTIFDAKRLIGRRFSEETVKEQMKLWPFKVEAGEKDKPVITVMHNGQQLRFSPEEISSMVLYKMKEIAQTYLDREVKDAVITVPAYFNDSQRRATRDAGKIAGLNVMQIINEPTAAALAYGLDELNRNQTGRRKPQNVFVFDFGGGTLDVCVLVIECGVIEVKAVSGDTQLGGQDIDRIMMDHFAGEFSRKNGKNMTESPRAVARLRAACERAKRTLSTASVAEIEVDSLYEGIDFRASITRAKFEDLNKKLFESCMVPVKMCLEDAGLARGDIQGVLLVGGSTRIPKVQDMLKEFFNVEALRSSVHPDEVVAHGAAIQAATRGQQGYNDCVLLDVTPLSLGMKVAGGIMVPVIERNSPIPFKKEKTFPTSVDYQRGITFQVYEGERSMVADNNLLGEFVLDGLEPRPAGKVTVLVTFEIDTDGILNVSARDVNTDRMATITITNDKGRLTREEIGAMMEAASKYRLEDEGRKRAAIARFELEELLYSLKKDLATSNLEKAEKQRLKSSINETLEWAETNEHIADAHQFRSKKNWVTNWWKMVLGTTVQLGTAAAAIAMEFE